MALQFLYHCFAILRGKIHRPIHPLLWKCLFLIDFVKMVMKLITAIGCSRVFYEYYSIDTCVCVCDFFSRMLAFQNPVMFFIFFLPSLLFE